MRPLRRNTATAILFGPMLDDTDGKTPETALTVTSFDADLYKASDSHPLTKSDLTVTASGGSNDCAHVANGYYSLELTAGNVDTAGRLRLSINIAGALPIWEEFVVLPETVYDALYGASDELHLCKAALVNRVEHDYANKRTTIYDDDESTVLVTIDHEAITDGVRENPQ